MRWPAAAVLVASTGLTAATSVTPSAWDVDPPHTQVQFNAKHFFTPVSGAFDEFDIELAYDPEHPERSTVTARIAVASVNTGSEKRDGHLRSGDFFDAEKHPYITFESKSVRQVGEGKLIARGPLTIKGVAREIELPIEVLGVQAIPEPMRPMLGGVRDIASFRANTRLDRRDFGVGVGDWAATLIVGKEIDVRIAVEASRK